ncbi:hypothetical protein HAX54_006064, partial [Datura stramonium]|nr:hypothetical protein [Datura stramonium]
FLKIRNSLPAIQMLFQQSEQDIIAEKDKQSTLVTAQCSPLRSPFFEILLEELKTRDSLKRGQKNERMNKE